MPYRLAARYQQCLKYLPHRANAVRLTHQPRMKIQSQHPTTLLAALADQ
jgi:hypothetical protein